VAIAFAASWKPLTYSKARAAKIRSAISVMARAGAGLCGAGARRPLSSAAAPSS
jgi:hypothetical protein